MDCGKSLKSSVMEAVLLESRALAVVSSPSVEATRKTGTTLKWLHNNGYQKPISETSLQRNIIERVIRRAGCIVEMTAARCTVATS